MSARALSGLVCGRSRSDVAGDDFSRMMASISDQVADYFDFALKYRGVAGTKEASYFLPLSLRSAMESACSGLLARVDPVRVLYAAKCQASASYDKSSQQGASLKWQGDFVPADKRNGSSAGGQAGSPGALIIWDPNVGREKIPRSMFSHQVCDVLWVPAHKEFTDWYAKSGVSSIALAELAAIGSSDLRDELVTGGTKLYSELSKGIHPEFLISRQAEFDEATLVDLADKTTRWTLKLSTLSHFSHLCAASIAANELKSLVEDVEGAIAK